MLIAHLCSLRIAKCVLGILQQNQHAAMIGIPAQAPLNSSPAALLLCEGASL